MLSQKVSQFTGIAAGLGAALICVALSPLVGCGSSATAPKDAGPKGSGGALGTGGFVGAGSGGGLGSGGAVGSGGSMGTGGDLGTGGAVAIPCPSPPVINAMLTDFSMMGGFGFDGSNPQGVVYDPYGGPVGDVTMGNWHVNGMVTSYAGLQLKFSCPADASMGTPAWTGITFKISGNVGPTGTMRVLLGTGADSADIGGTDFNTETFDHARCKTTVATQYNDCVPPISPPFTVPATSTPTTPVTISIPFTSFSGGKPKATVDINEITVIQFVFSWNPNTDGNAAYPIDLTIDDVGFTGGPAVVDAGGQ
jgi:hypothetical protein